MEGHHLPSLPRALRARLGSGLVWTPSSPAQPSGSPQAIPGQAFPWGGSPCSLPLLAQGGALILIWATACDCSPSPPQGSATAPPQPGEASDPLAGTSSLQVPGRALASQGRTDGDRLRGEALCSGGPGAALPGSLSCLDFSWRSNCWSRPRAPCPPSHPVLLSPRGPRGGARLACMRACCEVRALHTPSWRLWFLTPLSDTRPRAPGGGLGGSGDRHWGQAVLDSGSDPAQAPGWGDPTANRRGPWAGAPGGLCGPAVACGCDRWSLGGGTLLALFHRAAGLGVCGRGRCRSNTRGWACLWRHTCLQEDVSQTRDATHPLLPCLRGAREIAQRPGTRWPCQAQSHAPALLRGAGRSAAAGGGLELDPPLLLPPVSPARAQDAVDAWSGPQSDVGLSFPGPPGGQHPRYSAPPGPARWSLSCLASR